MQHLVVFDSCSFNFVARDARVQDEYMEPYCAQCVETCVCVGWFEVVLHLGGNLAKTDRALSHLCWISLSNTGTFSQTAHIASRLC